MATETAHERRLSEVHTPRRNNYYYGKLMDVLHFQMEQRYEMSKRWLLNRTVLGAGVLCGLELRPIQTDAGKGLRIEPGLAIDGWGREILVPSPIDIVPLQETVEPSEPCSPSTGQGPPAEAQPAEKEDEGNEEGQAEHDGKGEHEGKGEHDAFLINLCYRECPSDYAPAAVMDPDCDDDRSSEPGTIIESYRISVKRGNARRLRDHCPEQISELIERGRVREALCELTEACAPAPSDPCVTIGWVQVEEGGEIDVRECRGRMLVPTNVQLMQLIMCLTKRVNECCEADEDDGDDQDERPRLRHDEDFRVRGARLLRTDEDFDTPSTELETLRDPARPMEVRHRDRPNAVEVEFEGGVFDEHSVDLGKTFLFRGPTTGGGLIMNAAANTITYSLWARGSQPPSRTFQPGRYFVTLTGTPDNNGRAVRSTSDLAPPRRLDGEPLGLPSGDGHEGGNFEFSFVVV